MKTPRFVYEYLNFVIREVENDFPGKHDDIAVARDTAMQYIRNYERGLIVLDEVMQAISCLRRAMREAEG